MQSSALGDGATQQWVDRDYAHWDRPTRARMSSLRRIMNYIGDGCRRRSIRCRSITTLAAAGASVFARQLRRRATSPGGARTGTVIPLDRDRHRPAPARHVDHGGGHAYNAYGEGHAWKFSQLPHRPTATSPCRSTACGSPARILHNGSVPSLADLLEPVEARPKQFWRGYDVFDPVRVGFVTERPRGAARAGTFLDMSRPGNSNAGHTYGTELPAAAKRALLEYLKTL